MGKKKHKKNRRAKDEVDVELAPKMLENFAEPARHRVFRGGRGSGKTRGLAKMSAIKVYEFAEAGRSGVWLCSREHLNSLDESSLSEIKAAIRSEPWLNDYFEIGERYIRTKNKLISYAFAGLRQNLDSIKSKSQILGNWTDEAEKVSEPAWRKLIPTIREADSENWVSYNPESMDSATHQRFIVNQPTACIITEMNWRDNPWFPEVLNTERLDDQRLRPDTYDHVWEGGFLTITDAQVFKGKTRVVAFEPNRTSWDGPYYGLDWGFANDPTAITEWWIHDKQLWCRREAVKVGLELDDTAEFAMDRMPGIEKYVIRADNARPESISHVSRKSPHRKSLPRLTACDKWPGSVEDGIEHLKSYEKINIHPDCPEMAREARVYSYKIDKNTEDILPIILDANNHCWDSGRYALGPMIRARSMPRVRAL